MVKKLLILLFACAAAGVVLFSFYAPSRAPSLEISVAWEDGSFGAESYADALASLGGGDEEGLLFFEGDRRGKAAGSQNYRAAYRVLGQGSFAELASLDLLSLDPFSRLALLRTFGETAYFADRAYRFTGERIEAREGKAETVKHFFGNFPAGYLASCNATRLVLAGGELTASDLAGSNVQTVVAQPPYRVRGEALYLDTVSGSRLIAGMPHAQDLQADMVYADMGALAPCMEVVSLTLPFVGRGEAFPESLAWMFGGSVPPSLTRLRVTGGKIAAGAFSGTSLQEINLCGVDPASVDGEAMYGADELRVLVAPREGLLEGYQTRVLPCGCIEYRRNG